LIRYAEAMRLVGQLRSGHSSFGAAIKLHRRVVIVISLLIVLVLYHALWGMLVMAVSQPSEYGWTNGQPPHTFAYLEPCILAILGKAGAKRVLDLGSGNGVLCAALRSSGYRVVGVEADRGGIEAARTSFPGIGFYQGNIDDGPDATLLREGPFDAVVSTEVVEHLYSPHRLPAYASAVLGPGGLLVVSTPYHGFLKNLVLSIFNAWDAHLTALWCGGHIKFWSRKTLTALLSENGFDVIQFHGVGRLPYLWKSMVVVARKR
jgi:2-polyprenyl-3-methyl-5-hydroxy-6-metoxy-1,4-benzoquinol methylase